MAFDPMAEALGASNASSFNTRWWLEKDDVRKASSALAVFDALLQQDRPRLDRDLHHFRLYGNHSVAGFRRKKHVRRRHRNVLTLNVVANVCDSATARVGSIRPLPTPQTVGGNRSIQRRGRLLRSFFQAQFRISDVHREARQAFRDATIVGSTALKCYEQNDQIDVERVLSAELLVDHHEALHGEPRQLFQRKWVARDVLAEMFLDKDKRKNKPAIMAAISGAGRGDETDLLCPPQEEGVHDQVLVVEAWHLPSGPDAEDGYHAIFTTAGPLLVEKWEHDYFPFVFFHWKRPPRGFWGSGIAEEINGIQVEINRLLQKIQLAFQKLAVPRIFLDAGSKITKTHINNEIGAFVPYVGRPPIISSPQTIHPELFQHLGWLYQRAFEIPGLSQDTASPDQRTISGVSAQTQHEISSERFRVQIMDFEQMFLDLSRQMVDRARSIHSRTKKFAFPAEKDRGTVDFIRWEDVNMRDDEYVLDLVSQSALPTLPGPKTDRVIMWLQNGLIDLADAKSLLDFPDMETFLSLDKAAVEDIDRIVENILDEGIVEPAEPYMDLQLALKRGQMHLLRARGMHVEEENLEKLRLWLRQVHKLQQKAAVEQQKLSMAAGAVGGATPAPAPGAPPAPGNAGAPPTAVQPTDGV